MMAISLLNRAKRGLLRGDERPAIGRYRGAVVSCRWAPLLVVAALALSMADHARASSVDYLLEINPSAGAFNLFAAASLGDNGGIAALGVDLMNIDSPVDLRLPRALDLGGSSDDAAAFSVFRSSTNPIGGFQDTFGVFSGSVLVYGFGQAPGDLESVLTSPSAFFVQPQYDAKLLVASGTFDTAGPLPDFGATLDALVFASEGDPTLETPTISTLVLLVPEPTSLVIVAFGVLATAGRRR